MTPLVSVVIPSFNNEKYLPDAIESIRRQTVTDIEVIIVDDGSSDGSAAIAAEYARQDRRIRLLTRTRDPSLVSGARAANAGIAETRGEFIARMDSDDIALPGRLERQLAHMKLHDLDICGGQAEKFGGETGRMWYPEGHDGIRSVLCFRSGLLNPTLLVRGDLMRTARYGEEEAFEEYEFQTRMFFSGRMGNVPECVHRFRVHPNNTTSVFTHQKGSSRWRLRFQYFFRLFPEAVVADFQVVHAVAWKIPLETVAELRNAGRWLIELSRVSDPGVRAYMAKRWESTCAMAAAKDLSLGQDIAARIVAPPG